jgi:hypothetical protein
MARRDFLFTPARDESLQMFQLGRSTTPLLLLSLPERALPISVSRRSEVRLEPDHDGIRLVALSLVSGLYRRGGMEGVIAVQRQLPIESGTISLEASARGVVVALPQELFSAHLTLIDPPLAPSGQPLLWVGLAFLILAALSVFRRREIHLPPDEPLVIEAELPEVDLFMDEPTPLPQLVPQSQSVALGLAEAVPASTEVAGRYRVLEQLARGASSDVYLARPSTHELYSRSDARIFAVKVVRPSVGPMLPEAAFEAAMSRAIRVHHPNVVRVHEYGRCDEGYFVAMEYVEGVPLEALLSELGRRDERLPVRCALVVGTALARGLEAIHGARANDGAPLGLLHGALRPDKVLLGRRNTIKIADVGLSLVLPRSTGVAYQAPEASHGVVDVRSDVYAVGAILRELVKDPPPGLEEIIGRAVHPRSAERYLSCALLAYDLETFALEAGGPAALTLGDWVDRLR